MRSTWEDLIEYFRHAKGNCFPEGTQFRALYFYGPQIVLPDGLPQSPCVIHRFENPVSEEVACAAIVAAAKDGGVMAENGLFIPWPVGAVYFERIEAPGKTSPA